MQTCPNDRRKFENILVRLDLDGEVVRKIPVRNQAEPEEEGTLLDVTECQVILNISFPFLTENKRILI